MRTFCIIFFCSDFHICFFRKEKLKDITNWLKKQEVYNIERQQCGTWTVDPDVVKKLEELVDYYNSENPKIKSVIMQVKPHLLFKVIYLYVYTVAGKYV